MKKFFATTGVLFVLVMVFFFAPCRSYAINPQPEPPGDKSLINTNASYLGTITKIDGARITVKNDNGVEKIVTGNFQGIKIGSRVKVTTKNGRTWLNPQPEPPFPSVKQKKLQEKPQAPVNPAK